MSAFHAMTWTCHVCDDERPDEFISVFKRKVVKGTGLGQGNHQVEITENIRFCNDRPSCAEGAKDRTFLGE